MADHDAILQWTKCHQVSLEQNERPIAGRQLQIFQKDR